MTVEIPIRELITGVRDAAVAAWGMSIDLGYPRTKRTLPYGAVELAPIERDWNGNRVGSSIEFIITGRWVLPGPGDDLVELVKADRANELVPLLQTAPVFAGLGMNPIVKKVDPLDAEDLEHGAFQVSITFSVETIEKHNAGQEDD